MQNCERVTIPSNQISRYLVRTQVVSDLRRIQGSHAETPLPRLLSDELIEKLKSFCDALIKKSADIFLSLLALPVLLVLIGIMGIAIRLDSPGPAILVQKRMGQKKKIFKCLKFRTMSLDADEILVSHLAMDKDAKAEWAQYKKLRTYDPRVTRVGRFLRKTSLDELPQVFNVLKGEMSFFGPRPYLPHEERDMEDYSEVILQVPPGITGLWQVSGRNGLTFQDRLKLDAFYVRNRSLWMDAVIFFKTIKVVLRKDGAY